MRDRLHGGYFQTPRSRRLDRDFQEMQTLADDSTIFSFQAAGQPPDHYRIAFHGKTLVPGPDGKPVIGEHQEAEIKLGIDYPRGAPGIKWLTPIVHPNIWGAGTVCLGTFWNSWTPYYHLTDLAEILWDMARLAILNPHSAGTTGRNERSTWEELAHTFGFPVDKRPLRDKRLGPEEPSSVLRQTGDPGVIVWVDDDPGCPPGKKSR